jgi:hypothetical protein
MGKNCIFGWPVYSVFDEVKPFDGNIEAGFYYVNTTNFFPFKGAGWYDAESVYREIYSSYIMEMYGAAPKL